MYLYHFGLVEHPFSLTPDPQFYFNSQSHREVLSTLLMAIDQREGFIKIVGEVGTGKTLLSRKLQVGLGQQCVAIYIANPYLTPEELKWVIAEQLGITYSAALPSYQLLKEIQSHLLALEQQKKKAVLIIDEAQAMPRETIESLRLLTNLETEKNKLLQVVLFGQPELDQLLNRPDLRQLKQRIVFSQYLRTIPKSSITDYLACRLQSAGYKGQELFSKAAISLLYRVSGGVPRLINVLAHKALCEAYAESASEVRRHHLDKAVKDTSEVQKKPYSEHYKFVPVVLLFLIIASGVFIWQYRYQYNEEEIKVTRIESQLNNLSSQLVAVSTSLQKNLSKELPVEELPPITEAEIPEKIEKIQPEDVSLLENKVQLENIAVTNALEIKPSINWLELFNLYASQGDAEKLNETLQQSQLHQAHGPDRLAHTFYSAKLAILNGQDQDAISILESQLTEAENDEDYRSLLAGLYQRNGRPAEAANHYQRLITAFGEAPAYWLGYALAQDALNNDITATEAYKRVSQYTELQPQVRDYVIQRLAELEQ